MEDARVAEPVIPFRCVRKLVQYYYLIFCVLHEVLNDVVSDETTTARDDAPLARVKIDASKPIMKRALRSQLCPSTYHPHDAVAVSRANPPANWQTEELFREDIKLWQASRV
eukprot:scaffold107506_cov37-Tisochrysis_lutea.AAC.2